MPLIQIKMGARITIASWMVPLPAPSIAAIHVASAMLRMTLLMTSTMVEVTPIVDTLACTTDEYNLLLVPDPVL
jgi:hypothetical protein